MIVGQYLEQKNNFNESLKLSVIPNEIMSKWDRCNLVSNFCAKYIEKNGETNKNISNSLSVIINELVENAVKYSSNLQDKILLHIFQKNNSILIELNTMINKKQYKKLKNISRIVSNKKLANEKYNEILSSDYYANHLSGIGLFMIVNYFQAEISFKFEQSSKKVDYNTSEQVKIKLMELLA